MPHAIVCHARLDQECLQGKTLPGTPFPYYLRHLEGVQYVKSIASQVLGSGKVRHSRPVGTPAVVPLTLLAPLWRGSWRQGSQKAAASAP